MAFYPKDVIYIAPNETILLKYVESFSFEREEADTVIDKLKDDYCFNIRTISCREYTVSTKLIADLLGSKYSGKVLAQDIYEKWLWIHKT